MKHFVPPKAKSWIVVRDPGNNQDGAIFDGSHIRCIGTDGVLDGFYDKEDAEKLAADWRVRYPTMGVGIFCYDESLFDLPPDWDSNLRGVADRCNALMDYECDLSTSPLEEWDAGTVSTLPPPRGWLLGNIFCRTFLSSLLGDGAVGKSALRYAQLISLASGRELTGDHVFERCRVLIISLEDDCHELERRIWAVCLHHKIDRASLKGWLYLAAPGGKAGKLMELDKRGRLIPGTLGDKLDWVIVKRNIDIVAIDPFIKSHAVGENDNNAIDSVVQVLTDLAFRHNIAADTPHHVSKAPPEPGNASRGRGASAMKDAARLVYTLTTMTPEEATRFGISEADRNYFIRMDKGKVNITPPARVARWFRLVNVRLSNATTLYPHGDEVQTVEPWYPPDTWKSMSDEVTDRILAEIDAGFPDGGRYSDAPRAETRAAWKVVVKHAPDKTKTQARELIKEWIKNGVLEVREYTDPKRREPADGLWWVKGQPRREEVDEELPL